MVPSVSIGCARLCRDDEACVASKKKAERVDLNGVGRLAVCRVQICNFVVCCCKVQS